MEGLPAVLWSSVLSFLSLRDLRQQQTRRRRGARFYSGGFRACCRLMRSLAEKELECVGLSISVALPRVGAKSGVPPLVLQAVCGYFLDCTEYVFSSNASARVAVIRQTARSNIIIMGLQFL